MGWTAAAVAASITVGNPSDKAVLNAMARRACKDCGLTWAGVDALAQDTEMGKTRIREALAALVKSNLLVVARFPKGGRGVSTEYLVLTKVMKLSPAPCERCVGEMKNPPPRGAFARLSCGNPPPCGAFSEPTEPKPTGMGAVNPPPRGDHPEVIQHPEGKPESETSLPLGLTFAHPADDPAACQAAQDALRAVSGFPPPETRPKP